MRKTVIAILLSLCFVLTAGTGCYAPGNNAVSSITDIKNYSDMQTETDRIEVNFDNDTGKYFKFEVANKADVDAIMNIILNNKLHNLGGDLIPPGNNTVITIFQGEKSYTLSMRGIIDNGNYYAFSSADLQSKIIDLAIAQGAYDTETGVIYKVIDLTEIENYAEEEKITLNNKTEVVSLLSARYSDCKYFYLYDSADAAETHVLGPTETESFSDRYNDTLLLNKGELLLMYHIYRNYDAASHYITCPSFGEYVNNGNSMSMEFTFGLRHNYYLKINIVS